MIIGNINNSRMSNNPHHFFMGGKNMSNYAMKTSPPFFRPRFHATHHFANLLGLFSIFFAICPVIRVYSVFFCKRFYRTNIDSATEPNIYWSICCHTVPIYMLRSRIYDTITAGLAFGISICFLYHTLGVE